MFVSLQQLPRKHVISNTKLDTRVSVLLGSYLDGSDHSKEAPPVVADFRHLSDNATGAIILGGSIDRLLRHYGDALCLYKLCVYHANTFSSKINPVPEILEYIGIGDTTEEIIFFKCRWHWGGSKQENYIFPEQIDRFATNLNHDAWFQHPLNAMLLGQVGKFDAIDSIYTDVGRQLIDSNLICHEFRTPSKSAEQIGGFMKDLLWLEKTNDFEFPEDVVRYWQDQLVVVPFQHDSFLQKIAAGYPVRQNKIKKFLHKAPIDFNNSYVVDSQKYGNCVSLPLSYMDIVEKIEYFPCTDFRATMEYSPSQTPLLEIDYLTDRFVNLWPVSEPAFDKILTEIFSCLHNMYCSHNHNLCEQLALIAIERTFNEEILIEFIHWDAKLDYAFHVDLALLSYCSFSVGRFVSTGSHIPL